MEFYEWLTQKYIEWRGPAIGREKSITEFAEFLGLSQPVISDYMTRGGSKPKSTKSLTAIAAKYPDIYEVLGVKRPADDPLLDFPPEEREALLGAISEYRTELAKRGITTDSPEAREIIRSAFDKRGIKFDFTEKE